jgi:hypothetical protein
MEFWCNVLLICPICILTHAQILVAGPHDNLCRPSHSSLPARQHGRRLPRKGRQLKPSSDDLRKLVVLSLRGGSAPPRKREALCLVSKHRWKSSSTEKETVVRASFSCLGSPPLGNSSCSGRYGSGGERIAAVDVRDSMGWT